jgi:hypothetical protein
MLLEGQNYTDQLKRDILKRQGITPPRPLRRRWATIPEITRMDENETGPNVTRLKRQWGGRFNDPTRPVLIEKSPTDILRVRWYQKNFENAYFIGIIRNGFAVAEGIRRKEGYDIRTAALQWANVNSFLLSDFEHLQRQKIIRYETLSEKPEAVIREICEFIGISQDEIAVEGDWSIHKKVSSIKNMNWRSFERLSEEDYQIIEEAAGYMLKRLGYSRQERLENKR